MDQVDEVKSKVDIVEVISSYVPLKKAGRNLSGLCPFHSEKTPSFMVSPERQAFKCFGCSESGDVFTFLEKVEGWEFRETLEELAKRAGVKLRDFKPTGASKDKDKLIEINKLTGKFWHYLLVTHKSGERAREYLKKRGINEDLWSKFGIGYAPVGWENLSHFLAKRGFALPDMATAGLVIGREGRFGKEGYYDRFRERLMFPLKDSRGTVVGFAGRLLDSEAKEAKYMNSPQTPLFNKSAVLFGLDLARSAIREKNEAILVEGEFDALSTYQLGLKNVVASKGTALTQQQVALLSRVCDKVILCFDTDLAGDAAARRGIELMDMAGLSVKVVNLGTYKDPDEFAQKDSNGYKKALASAVDIYDYFIESASKRFDAGNADGKKKIGREVIPVVSKITDDLVRAHYIGKLSKILDLDVNLISEAVSKKSGNLEVEESSEIADVVGVKVSREEYFLALFVYHDEIIEEIVELLQPSDFENPQAVRFWEAMRDIIKHSSSRPKEARRTVSKIIAKLPKDLSGFVDSLYLVNIPAEFSEREDWAGEVVKVAGFIKRSSLRRKIAQISQRLKEAQGVEGPLKSEKLFKEFNKISKEIKTLNYAKNS